MGIGGLGQEDMEALRKYSLGVAMTAAGGQFAVDRDGQEVELAIEEGEWVEVMEEAGEDEIEDVRPCKVSLPRDKGSPVACVLAAGIGNYYLYRNYYYQVLFIQEIIIYIGA